MGFCATIGGFGIDQPRELRQTSGCPTCGTSIIFHMADATLRESSASLDGECKQGADSSPSSGFSSDNCGCEVCLRIYILCVSFWNNLFQVVAGVVYGVEFVGWEPCCRRCFSSSLRLRFCSAPTPYPQLLCFLSGTSFTLVFVILFSFVFFWKMAFIEERRVH